MPLNIIRQDITKMPCDVIVNATNRHMTCDQGVAAAIFDAAGDELSYYLQGTIQIGEVRVTPAFKLPCKYIFHVAGPIWQDGDLMEKKLLALCYKNVLKKAAELGATSIAIPLISSGSRGFPKEYVLDIAVETIAAFLMDEELNVYLIVYDKNSYSIGKELFGDITEYINDNYVAEDIIRQHRFLGLPQRLKRIQYLEDRRPKKQAYRITSDEVLLPNVGDEKQNARPVAHEDEQSAPSKDKKPVSHKEEIPPEAEPSAQHRKERPAPPEQKKDRLKISQFDESEGELLGDFILPREQAALFERSTPCKSAPAKYAEKPKSYDESDINAILKNADETFAETLFKLIDARHMTDLECYKKANVSRQTWHKIISDENYRPSKTTVIAFAIALKLNLDETKHLLETVGFALSKSIKFDLLIEYCVTNEIYDVYKINDILYQFDQPLLGV